LITEPLPMVCNCRELTRTPTVHSTTGNKGGRTAVPSRNERDSDFLL